MMLASVGSQKSLNDVMNLYDQCGHHRSLAMGVFLLSRVASYQLCFMRFILARRHAVAKRRNVSLGLARY